MLFVYVRSMLGASLLGLIPLLPVLALFHLIALKRNRTNHCTRVIPHNAATYIFCYVLLCVFHATAVPNAYHLAADPNMNLIPLAGMMTAPFQTILNILLFVPVGFLLPALWEKFEKKHVTFLYGFLFSLFIEMMQLLNYRTTDINDLFMNTAGTIAGCFLFVPVKRALPKVSIFSAGYTGYWKWEPYSCFCLAWMFVFFVQPLIVNWFWGFHF